MKQTATTQMIERSREGVKEYFLRQGHGANMTTSSAAAIHLLSWFRSGIRLHAEDFQCEPLSVPEKQAQYLEFVFLVAATHPKFSRVWNPSLWDTVVREIWKERCDSHRTPFTPRPRVPIANKQILSMIKNMEDLTSFFDQLIGIWKYVPPEFLATRPPYMKPHGDQAEPSWGVYPPLFEAFFTSCDHYAILTASPQEQDAFFLRFSPQLPMLAQYEYILRRNWYFYQNDFYTKKRNQFKRHVRQLIIAEAMRPERVAAMLEAHGFDAIEDVFGC